MVPYDASRAASAPANPSRRAISRTEVGTYTDPAHSPMIDTSRYSELSTVLRAYPGAKILANASVMAGRRLSLTRLVQAVDSLTPYRMNVTSSAGVPPTTNIH